MTPRTAHRALTIPFLALLAIPLCAQERGAAKPPGEQEDIKTYIRANYTKYEYMAPMRDGARLFVAVYAPKDRSKTYPIWMMRTPYEVSPYGADNYREKLGPSERFARSGYIFAYCDVRGKGKSEGKFEHVRPFIPNKTGAQVDEASDTYDTIEFLLKTVPNHNGRVGISGTSYPGFYATMAVLSRHPALRAASPQAPVTEWFLGDDFRHNGAFFLAHAFGFYSRFGRRRPGENEIAGPVFDFATPDGYNFFLRAGPLANIDEKYFQGEIEWWRELVANETYTDFWKARDPRPHLKNIEAAVLTVGGWFDAEDVFGPLRTYEAIEKQSPGAVNLLVEGPWSHGQWNGGDADHLGDIQFHQKTGKFFREQIEYPFFAHYLKGEDSMSLPEAFVFETGRNEWRRMDSWPPKGTTPRALYFREGGKLSADAPAAGDVFDEYVSDPDKPVPHISWVSTEMTYEYMNGDQRFASSRPDVLVYQTEPLDEDLTVAGPLTARLHVSTTGTDSDWVVKLIDVYPGGFPDPEPNPRKVRLGGYQQLVRGEPFRGRFRRSFEKPEPFVPGRPDLVEFELPDVYHTFRRGHRLMVHIQSTWFPLVDRNPQTFVKISEAKTSDFRKATQRVYRSAAMPSGITIPVLREE